jgi:hypothetical protein
MKKVALYAVILVASGLVFSADVFADDLTPEKFPQVNNQTEQTREDGRQGNQAGAVKQEKQRQGEQNNPSPYGEEYWEKDPQLHLWEQPDFVQSWYSDC